jgi:hypothetical protein
LRVVWNVYATVELEFCRLAFQIPSITLGTELEPQAVRMDVTNRRESNRLTFMSTPAT